MSAGSVVRAGAVDGSVPVLPRLLACVAGLLLLASPAFAQVIYEPVQFRYGDRDGGFFYGGDDPAVIAAGKRVEALRDTLPLFRDVRVPPAVYTDVLPYRDARIFGFTRGDARDEAYANVPRHFRKADLLKNAIVTDDAVIVPPFAPADRRGTIDLRIHEPAPRHRGSTPVIVFPKDLLDQPLPPRPAEKPQQARAF